MLGIISATRVPFLHPFACRYARTAAERGEAGSEDRARIDEIGIGDDAFGERGPGFGDERLDEPLGKSWRRRRGSLFRRLSAAVVVESALRLAPEVSRRHQFRQL